MAKQVVHDLLHRFYANRGTLERMHRPSIDRMLIGFDFLTKMRPDIKDGVYSIDGKGTFCNVQTYNTKDMEEAIFETHRKYIDIQYIIEGTELILAARRDKLRPVVPYDAEKDIAFWTLKMPPEDIDLQEIIMNQGWFAVFYPIDAHAPQLTHQRECEVRKAVVKVLL
ncbi:MAG: YhcH/YjgK/YiaL family protein [Candidatus Woesearchaeota archaeon]